MPNHTTRPGTETEEIRHYGGLARGMGVPRDGSACADWLAGWDEKDALLRSLFVKEGCQPMRVSGGMQGAEPERALAPYPGKALVPPLPAGMSLPIGQGIGQAPPTPKWLATEEDRIAAEKLEAETGCRVRIDPRPPVDQKIIADVAGRLEAGAGAYHALADLEERHQTLGKNYTSLERAFAASQHRIVELEARVLEAEDQWGLYADAARVADLEKRLAAAEADRSDVCGYYEDLLAATEHPKPANDTEKRVNDMIDDLSARKVSTPDRARLRGAIDKAEKPLAGRAGQDEALNNISRRPSGWRSL